MKFSKKIALIIEERHLLKHPFYKDWVAGHLSLNQLQNYACQYYWHVEAFPRYISATHSLCSSIEERRLLLENLVDEEGLKPGHDPHPELWLRFVEGLKVLRKKLLSNEAMKPKLSIRKLIDVFNKYSRSSYSEGLSALYAYEYQIPEIAESKIEGLKKHYQIKDERSLSFFTVHKEADKIHRKICEQQLDRFDDREQKNAPHVVKDVLDHLWNFLSEAHQHKKLIS